MNKKLTLGIGDILLMQARRARHHVHYLKLKAWQRSCRPHPLKSRCRHARKLTFKGYPYKGKR